MISLAVGFLFKIKTIQSRTIRRKRSLFLGELCSNSSKDEKTGTKDGLITHDNEFFLCILTDVPGVVVINIRFESLSEDGVPWGT